jgi:hypothetical protein
MFGVERTLDLVSRCRHLTSSEIIENVQEGVRQYCRPVVSKDDSTIVIVKALGVTASSRIEGVAGLERQDACAGTVPGEIPA